MWGSGFPLVDYLPRFLLGGLLMQMGRGMLLDWAVLVTRRVQWSGTVVIWAMVGISVFSDITHGIALGLVLAVGFISLRLTKLEVLKYHVTGIHFRSGALYSDAQRSILKKYGDRTQVVGLTGFVFEGVAIAFATYLKEVVRGSQDLKTLVIDCAACQGMNDSACSHFLKVAQMCASKDVALVFCSLSPYDEMLLLSWNLAPYGCRIVPSVSEALEDAEHDTLRDLLQPVTPTLRTGGNEPKIQALERWLGKGTVQELLGIGEFCTFETNEVISGQDAIIDALLITVPGFSDVQIEVQTGTQNKPARLLRTSHGAVCPAEALIGSHCRGRWVANDETVGFLIKPVQALKSSSKRHAFATLSSIALHQQMLQTDQLSAMYTLSKGGGWRGVTFDASTSKRPVKALEGFGPRLRSSHAKRKEFARVGSRATAAESSFDVGKLSTPPAKDRPRAATNSPDDEIPVAAVLDFQRFVSSSERPSLGSAEADEIIDKAESTRTLSDNVVFNRRKALGPRYIEFHPTLPICYVVNELASDISVFEFDHEATEAIIKGGRPGAAQAQPTLRLVQSVRTIPDAFPGEANTCGRVAVHSSGNFVLVSNRGHDSITVFRVHYTHGHRGLLSVAVTQHTRGATPRHFQFDSSGQWLITANQDSDNISVFRFNLATGKLEWTGNEYEVPSPNFVCNVVPHQSSEEGPRSSL
eukprot:s6604_g4.t1